MRNWLYLFILMISVQTAQATENIQQLYQQLEHVLTQRKAISLRKEATIDSIRQLITPNLSSRQRFHYYQLLYQEYHTYRSDSALYYISKAEQIAVIPIHRYSKNNAPFTMHTCWPLSDISHNRFLF